MDETKTTGDKTLSVERKKTLSLKRNVEQGMVRQSFSHGRSKAVVVEKKKRRIASPSETAQAPAQPAPAQRAPERTPREARDERPERADRARQGVVLARTGVELLDPAYAPVAQIESARTQLATAEELVGEAQRGFELQARNAYLQVSGSADRHAVAAERAAAAEERLALQQVRLESGLISEVQLTQAAMETQQQSLELQRARHDHLLALLRLQAATMHDFGLSPVTSTAPTTEGPR